MQEIKFQVDEQTVNNLQRLAIETESRQSLIAFMLNQDIINQKNFEIYQDEYKKFYFDYTTAKNNFQKDFVDPILLEKNIAVEKASWKLNFNTNEATITINE